jgi:histone H1/5
MIKDAILQLKERNGSSRPALKKYILKNYNITAPNFESLFNTALKRGVEKDEFVMPKGPSGTVKLQKASKEAAKKEAAKKDTATKKTTTKKAAPKKTTTSTATTKKAAPKKKTAAKKPATKASATKVSKPAPVKMTTTKSGRKVKASA